LRPTSREKKEYYYDVDRKQNPNNSLLKVFSKAEETFLLSISRLKMTAKIKALIPFSALYSYQDHNIRTLLKCPVNYT
jgi:hypothetical protein